MNDKPTRDGFEDLINKINEPSYGEEGPDILAVRRHDPVPTGGAAVPSRAASSRPVLTPEVPASRGEEKILWKTPAAKAPKAEPPRGAPMERQPASRKKQFVLNIDDEEFGSIPDLASGGEGTGAVPPPGRPTDGRPPRKPPEGGKPRGKGLWGMNRWLRAFILALAIVAVAIFFAFFALESFTDLTGLNQEDKKIEVTVTEDMSSSQIVDLLVDSGVVEKKLTFQVYAGVLKNAYSKFKPGDYVMNANFSYDQIIQMLRGGSTAEPAVVRVSFYEGMTAWEIAERLEENKVCKAKDFIQALNTEDFSDYEFMSIIPEEQENRYIKLEGFLFPDTYDFYVDDKPVRVAAKFFNNFENKVDDQMIARMNDLNLTLYEAITFASIVQGEAADEANMSKVSSVFHNRFSSSTYPRMESDVTRDYAKYDIKNHASDMGITDQQTLETMMTAYDSYQSNGLPPGPVGNPGLDAIRATLYPEDTPYYFFVTYLDDEGPHYLYAVTFEEHTTNVYNARKAGEAHGVAVE